MQGRLLAGRYRLADPIGSGGMGRVWHAHDELLSRAVAIKELTASLYASEGDRAVLLARTRSEARAAARINHSAVVTVHDVLEHDGRPWIVMELVEGGSLADTVKEQGRVEPAEAARIGMWVLRALRAAHTAGVLHRDVKPGNVLLGHDRRILLTDFGIAQIEGDSTITRTGEVIGSVDYLAPERVRGNAPGPASDLWALGATLYTAVEGRSPFRRTSPLSTMQAVVEEEAEVPRHAGPLAPIISALLRKDPATRPDAAEAEQMLAEAAEGRNPRAAQAYVPTEHAPLRGPAGGVPPTGPTSVYGTGTGFPPGTGSTGPSYGGTGSTGPSYGPAAPGGPGTPAGTPAGAGASGGAGLPGGTGGTGGTGRTGAPGGPGTAAPGPPYRPGDGVYGPYGPAGGAPPAGPAGRTPRTGPTTPPPAPRRRGRRLRILALVVAVAAVVGAGTAVVLQQWDRDRTGRGGPTGSPSVSASATGSPHPASAGGTVPDGWHSVTDPLGFQLALPDGWQRQVFSQSGDLTQIDYTPDGGEHFLRVAIDKSPDFADPNLHQLDLEEQLQRLVDYARVTLKPNTYRDRPASLWDYTWTALAKDTEFPGPRRATDETYIDRDGTEYALYMSAPAKDWETARKQFTTVLQTWQPHV
ncbi:serine/threonine-protein kinase [Streptomyces sp. MS06]|uniref:serine/threonine-protein kinase n=1 Tax=Streptomyces sp. MS06 TaxID=3385974 RepID=UPI0039A3611A